jgi:hypothetical protein
VYTCCRASIEEYGEVVYSIVPSGYQTGYILAFFDVSEITETHEFSDSDFRFFFLFFFSKDGNRRFFDSEILMNWNGTVSYLKIK